ncbi:Transcription factor iws1 [Arthrobotrys musiformis]|uniref:Transcription factor iws1 n=1 Tax=Arthrobotrys musiformis TaxID=47236 RepID=A0AAV9W876_9PEZI
MSEIATGDNPITGDASSKPPTPKGIESISDMEISDNEPEPPRKKIVTQGLDSEEDVAPADQGRSADKDNNPADADSDIEDISDLEADLDEELAELGDFDDDDDADIDGGKGEVVIDQDAVRKMGVHRRAPGEASVGRKKKEPRRSRKTRDDTRDTGSDGGEGPVKESRPLTEAERKLKDLDNKISKATKAPRKRKQDGDSTHWDDLLADLTARMTSAVKHDIADKGAGRPATRKLTMLPEVVAAFRSKDMRMNMDGEILKALRFWLEPLPDRSLPAYDIQRELFQILVDMPDIKYDELRISGLGKLLNFYIRDARPQQHIRFTAQKLYENWSRPILEKSNNYRHRKIETADFDQTQKRARTKLSDLKDKPDALAPPQLKSNRTRVPDATPQTYTIAPKSKVVAPDLKTARPLGANAEDQIRRLKARATGKIGRGSGRGGA